MGGSLGGARAWPLVPWVPIHVPQRLECCDKATGAPGMSAWSGVRPAQSGGGESASALCFPRKPPCTVVLGLP